MKKPENLEFKLLMKNIKKNRNIIENRIKTRQEFKLKREEQNKKLDLIRERNELNLKNKKANYYKRQMSRDLKDLQKRYQILNNENDIYFNDNKLKNRKPGIEINAFSNIHRHHVNEVKNNFYNKNKNLKFIIDNNKIDTNKNKDLNNIINKANFGGNAINIKKIK